MPIWSSEIKELERLYESLKGLLPDLEKELGRLIKADDENMILLYSRRCLEVIITDLCECELKRERGTEPLKGVIDKLHKEKKIPPHIIASIHSLNELSTFGTHPKDFDPEQVKPVLINLDIIIKWFLRHKETSTETKAKSTAEVREEIKSIEEVKKNKTIPKNKLIVIISSIIAVILIVFSILLISKKELEKSIAVLPFINESPVDSNKHFINGIMEEILNNLQTIKEFRVLSRTSTDQYKGSDRPTMPEIAKKLGVSYLVEGSGQKYGNNFTLRVQLIRAKGKEAHIWGETYNKEIREVGDYVRIQSEIAKAIAAELKVVITPDEKLLIEKVPTASLNALDFYQMGREEEGNFPYYDLIISSTIEAGVNPSTRHSLERAEKMYKIAIQFDSTFALAYTGLAGIYWGKNYFKEYFSENFMDSVYNLAQKALSFDDQLADGYFIRGMYFSENSKYQQAHEDFDKTLKLNPNYWQAYYGKGLHEKDYVNAIKNLHEAACRHQGPGLSEIYNRISFNLSVTGFSELAKKYSLEAVKLDSDSSKYYFWLWMYEFDYKAAFGYFHRMYSVDPANIPALQFLSNYYVYSGQFKEAIEFYRIRMAREKATDRTTFNEMHRVGYAHYKYGNADSAEYYFNKQIEYCLDAIRLDRSSYQTAYYDLAGVYAFMGDKIKAYEYLKIYGLKPNTNLWLRKFITHDPLFDSIRDEPKFQQIVRDFESRYQAVHERTKEWLEEQGML